MGNWPYCAIGGIDHNEINSSIRNLRKMAIEDGSVASTVVASVWPAPKMPRIHRTESTDTILDVGNVRRWRRVKGKTV